MLFVGFLMDLRRFQGRVSRGFMNVSRSVRGDKGGSQEPSKRTKDFRSVSWHF